MSAIDTYGLPADVDCERFVLGLVLKNFAVYHPQVADTLVELDFIVESHRDIWRAITKLRSAGSAVDRVTIFKHFAQFGQEAIDKIGGLSGLTDMEDGVPDIPNIGDYATRVRMKSTLRQAVELCRVTIERLCLPTATTDDVLAAEKVIRKLSESTQPPQRFKSLGEVIRGDGSAEAWKAFSQPQLTENGLPFPWYRLNAATGGLRPGNLAIVAARPGAGKTTLATQLSVFLAGMRRQVVFVSLEMGEVDIARKVVAARAEVGLNDWMNGTLNQGEARAITKASAELSTLTMYMDERKQVTAPGLHTALIRHKAEFGLDLVVIDYLGIMQATGRQSNRNEDLSDITRSVKLAAMELQVPFLCLSQLNRESEKQGRRPRLSDLRDSGSIEQDADIVMFLHPSAQKDVLELILAKQRLGPTGLFYMHFDKRIGTFTETEMEYENG